MHRITVSANHGAAGNARSLELGDYAETRVMDRLPIWVVIENGACSVVVYGE